MDFRINKGISVTVSASPLELGQTDPSFTMVLITVQMRYEEAGAQRDCGREERGQGRAAGGEDVEHD